MNLMLQNKMSVQDSVPFIRKARSLTRCPSCKNVHYKGVWYAPDSRFAILLDEKKDSFIEHSCPACEMQREGRFAGAVYVKDIPKKLLPAVERVMFTTAHHDYLENPQHRIVEFSEIVDGYKVTTTSALMASRIGQKIQSLFGACSLHATYQYTQGPAVQVVKVMFMPAV